MRPFPPQSQLAVVSPNFPSYPAALADVSSLGFNVRDFGARGDGITDDLAAIQQAIHAAQENGGGVVYFPPGTYGIAGVIEIPSKIALVGDGAAVSVIKQLLTGTVTVDVIRNVDYLTTGNSDIAIRNLTIVGPADAVTTTANNPRCLRFVRVRDVIIAQCVVTRGANGGIWIGPGSSNVWITGNRCLDNRDFSIAALNEEDGATTSETISHLWITHNIILNPTEAENFGGIFVGEQLEDAVITGNVIDQTGGISSDGITVGIDFDIGGFGSRRVLINDNVVRRASGNGISIYKAAQVTVQNNICELNGLNGITTIWYDTLEHIAIVGNVCRQNSRTGVLIDGGGTFVTISANLCHGNLQYGIVTQAAFGTPCVHFAIAQNVCTANIRGGILVQDTANAGSRAGAILGNVCSNNSVGTPNVYEGIRVHGACQDVAIVGNACCDTQAVPTQALGVSVTGTASRILVRDNAAFGNVGGQQQLANNNKIVLVTANYTISDAGVDEVVLVDASAGAVTVTLPHSTAITGYRVHIEKVDGSVNAVTIAAQGGDNIEGVGTMTLSAQYQSRVLVSDGANSWFRQASI